jgi:hypothetical protein
MNLQVDTFRHRRRDKESHERRLINAVAQAMFGRESHFVAMTTREALASRKSAGAAVSEHWLVRYEQYYRLWTRLTSLSGNLAAAIRGPRGDKPTFLPEYGSYALYDYATFLSALRDFVDGFGGLWIVVDANIEQAIADSVYVISHSAPTTHREDSHLRLMVGHNPELAEFLNEVEGDGGNTELLARWLDWIKSCRCDVEAPDPGRCKPHRMIAAANTYIDLIDASWYKLADWYREPPDYRTIIQPERLYWQMGLLADSVIWVVVAGDAAAAQIENACAVVEAAGFRPVAVPVLRSNSARRDRGNPTVVLLLSTSVKSFCERLDQDASPRWDEKLRAVVGGLRSAMELASTADGGGVELHDCEGTKIWLPHDIPDEAYPALFTALAAGHEGERTLMWDPPSAEWRVS